MPRMDALIRSTLRGPDRVAALRADQGRVADEDREAAQALRSRLRPFTSSNEGIYCGMTPGPDGDWLDVTLPFRVAHERSAWAMGTTGAGKTTLLLAQSVQDLATPERRFVGLDYQGSEAGFAVQLTRSIIPGLAVRLEPTRGAELLAGLRVVAPWQSQKLPSLHLTAAGDNVNTRAAALVDVFGATTSSAGAEFGPRMLSLTLPVTKLLIRRNVPLPLFADVLTNEEFREALATGCDDPQVAAYMRDRFATDFRDAGASVLSRLDRFFLDDATRLACFGPDPFDASDWIEHGTTVVNLGGGTALHRSFWAAFLQTGIIGAILTRKATKKSPRVLVRIDEAQLGLPSSTQARELDDALSRMRGRRAALVVAHQHAGQLSEYPYLKESLRTNCGAIVTFRVPEETFAASGCPVPDDDGVRPRVPEATNRKAWERVVSSLPDRCFLLHAPGLSGATIPVRAPEFQVEAFARGVPDDIVRLATEGQGGYLRQELHLREHAWRRVVSELSRTAEPNLEALARFASGGSRSRRARRTRTEAEVG